VSVVIDGLDDEVLFAALRQAIRNRRAVPPEWVAAAKNAFAWRNIDAELALLTYDSTQSPAAAAPTRSESASIRALTFSSPRLTVELEVTGDSLLGQVLPAQAAMIEVETRDGVAAAVPSDEIGCFSVHPIPVGTFRLRCRAADSSDVLTGWIMI
jgi:hypothetical protein